MRQFDAVVIGAGSGGLTAARRLALAGRRTALVEGERLGGDCLNWGCVPTKTLIATARLRHQLSRAADYGLRAGPAEVDFPALMARKAAVQAEVGGEERRYYIDQPGVEVVSGLARFADPHAVKAGEEELRFDHAVIATGSRAQVPSLPGLEESGYLTNVSILQLERLPASLLVIGGGPIGCEFAQMFRYLGSRVALVQRGGRLLPREEPEASAAIAAAFARDGLDVHFDAETVRVERAGDCRRLHLRRQGAEETLEAEEVLVAAGRLPNIENLNLEAAGIAWNTRGVVTDSRMRTTQTHIYAAGDVAGTYQFTHVAGEQGWVAAGNILGKRGRFHGHAVPWCTFTNPEVAHVGLTEAEARERHGAGVRVLTWPFRHVDRAATMGEQEGFIKLVTAPGWTRGLAGGEVVGAEIVGPEAGELIAEPALLVANRLPLGLLARTIHPYPTLSLGLRQDAAQVWDAPRGERAGR